mmetsp:Transcript_65247/g.183680  ORF Transcript_65247/g.183680 Transcript_65247/m.183680 type:complete len:312 (-) Transcript_65247:53-988(-)
MRPGRVGRPGGPLLVHLLPEVVAGAVVRDLLLPRLLERPGAFVEDVLVDRHVVVLQRAHRQYRARILEPVRGPAVVLELHVVLPHGLPVVPAYLGDERHTVVGQELVDAVSQHVQAFGIQHREVRRRALQHDGVHGLHCQLALRLLTDGCGDEAPDGVAADRKRTSVHCFLDALEGIVPHLVQRLQQRLALPYAVPGPLVGRHLDLVAPALRPDVVLHLGPRRAHIVAGAVENEEPQLRLQLLQSIRWRQQVPCFLWQLDVLGQSSVPRHPLQDRALRRLPVLPDVARDGLAGLQALLQLGVQVVEVHGLH